MKPSSLVHRWRAQAEPYRHAAHAWWRARTPREQRLLAVCAVVLPLALVWSALLQPAWQALDTARAQLPQLRSDMARLQTVVGEAQTLQQGRSARVSAAQVWLLLPGSVERAGLQGSVTLSNRPLGVDDRRWELRVEQAPVAPLLNWLAGLPRLAVRVQALTLTRAEVDGRVQAGVLSGQIVLVQDAP